MKHTKSIVASVLLVSAIAATSVFASNSSSSVMGMSYKMNMGNPFSNTGVIQLLKEKGITAPTPEEARAFQEKMQALQNAEKSLSTEGKAQLELLRKSFRKQERDFYRTQGVVLPSEVEIAKMEMIRDLLKLALGSGSLGMGQGMRHGMEGVKGEGRGMRRGMDDNKGNERGMREDMSHRETRGMKNGQPKGPKATPATPATPGETN